MRRRWRSWALALVLVGGCTGWPFQGADIRPPGRPEPEPPPNRPAEPGSAQYRHARVATTRIGSGPEEVFIYEPGDPTPDSAPVTVFLHGYTVMNPMGYGAWIEHLVRRGNIVLYPVYQVDLADPLEYSANALTAVQNAYAELEAGGHARPDPTGSVVVGHSLGCVIGMNFAAVAHASGLPPVRALLLLHAGDGDRLFAGLPSLKTEDYGRIPQDVLFLGVVGSADMTVGSEIAIEFYEAVSHIPQANREVVELFSDDHGEPDLLAIHGAPLAGDDAYDSGAGFLTQLYSLADIDAVNALDFNGYWKFLDGLTDAVFHGVHREYALGGTPEQADMGQWSDGTPIQPAARILPPNPTDGF